MARSSLTSDFNHQSIYSQARNSVHYTILKHDCNEFNQIPLDPNILTFKNQDVQSKFLHSLYINPISSKISQEFCSNLLRFYIYFSISSLIILISAAKLYSENNMTYNTLIFHIACIFSIVGIGYIILYLVLRKPYLLLNNQNIFAVFGLFWFIYLIIGNEFFLHKILEENASSNKINVSIALVGFVYYYRLLLFDSFKHIIIAIFLTLIIWVLLIIILYDYTTEIISEYLLILSYLV